jgi:Tfp pilus assembly protein FimT
MELMVTAALLGLLAMISVGALGPLVTRYRQLEAQHQAAQLVTQARAAARKRGRCYRVQVLAAGVPVAPGVVGDGLRVVRRADADCETTTPVLLPDPRYPDVLMPRGVTVRVPSASSLPEFRPSGYTQDLTDTSLLLGSAASPERLVTILRNGPVCTSLTSSPTPCP